MDANTLGRDGADWDERETEADRSYIWLRVVAETDAVEIPHSSLLLLYHPSEALRWLLTKQVYCLNTLLKQVIRRNCVGHAIVS